MCAITGFIDTAGLARDHWSVLRAMRDALAHRGPDGFGEWFDADARVALGHRRLAIIDLSEAGRQPMHSASSRYVIVFNGEIYNYGEMRKSLGKLGHRFRSETDTEVMLAAIEAWGLRVAVAQFIGMFAFALWDRHERRLHLVRDRIGKKPLYYRADGRTLLFASELRALRCFPRFEGRIDARSVATLLRYSYIPAPASIFNDVRKLPAGSILTCEVRDAGLSGISIDQYWSPLQVRREARARPFSGSYEEALQQLGDLVRDAARLRMVADVPLGALLSGGVDSSLVVAAMQAQTTSPVRTFCIGFREPRFDEAPHARAVARYLGTDHQELYVDAKHMLSLIPRMAQVFDEPMGDSSQVPTFAVCELARANVSVVLSGDGGDEIFGGYARYRWLRSWVQAARRAPYPFRAAVGRMLGLASRHATTDRARQLQKLQTFVAAADSVALYRNLVAHDNHVDELVLSGERGELPIARDAGEGGADYASDLMLLDQTLYLPDDILCKVDRVSMAVALECRAPLLDHRIVEFSARLPLGYKLDERNGKRVMRDLLYRSVPRELVDRPKWGFNVPLAAWLRGPLREWAESLLEGSHVRSTELLNVAAVGRLWGEFLGGRGHSEHLIWNILTLLSWQRHWSSVPALQQAGKFARAVG